MSWILFWKVVLVLALLSFGLLAVLVSVLGARDVRRPFRGLREVKRHEDSPNENDK